MRMILVYATFKLTDYKTMNLTIWTMTATF
jgi:hypothetical protein